MKFNVSEMLFKHPVEKIEFIEHLSHSVCLGGTKSSYRPSNKRSEGIKISGLAKMFDYLYPSKKQKNNVQMCIYMNLEANFAYIEMPNYIHAIITPFSIKIYEAYNNMDNWILLPLIAIQWMIKYKGENKLFDYLNKINDSSSCPNSCDVLFFLDEFYFFGKEKQLLENCDINFQEECVLSQAQTIFRMKDYTKKYGIVSSAFERKNKSQKKDSQTTQNYYEQLWKDIKKGKYILNYKWRDDLQEYIKPLSFLDNYVPDKMFWQLFSIFKIRTEKALNRIFEAEEKHLPVPEAKKEDCLNIFLHGRAGTGKSYLLYALSAAFGLPAPFTNCSKGTEEDTYEGITKVIDGQLTEIETSMIKVSQDGGMWIGEEFDLTDPEVNKGVFNQLTEYPYIAMKGGYKPIKRHPLAIFAATFNVGEQSPCMDPALSSRFVPSLRFKDPTKEDFIKRMIASGAKENTAANVYSMYKKILQILKDPEINGEECEEYIVPRLCIDSCNLIDKDGLNLITAIELCMINKIAEVRPDIADEVERIINYY